MKQSLNVVFPPGLCRSRRQEALIFSRDDNEPPDVGCYEVMVPPTSPTQSIAAKKSKLAWKIEISATHQLGVSANHALSRIVFEANTDLGYGKWTEMWEREDRPFAVRKAHDLAFVGEHVVCLLRPDQAELHLPKALSTLCVLGHLPAEILLRLIDESRIYPKLRRRGAEALVEEFNPQPKPMPRSLNVRPVVGKILRQLRLLKFKAAPADFAFAALRLQTKLKLIAPTPISEVPSTP